MPAKIINPTRGTDFEVFILDRHGNVVPCPIEFGGDKDNPLSIGRGCARQIDNVLAEFNIPPVTTKEEWIDYINYCLKKGNEILAPYNMSLVIKSSHMFSPKQFTQERHTAFGCEPSYCPYTWDTNEPSAEDAGNLRTSGFHIHLGVPAKDVDGEFIERLMFSFDKVMGLWSLEADPDDVRRQVYGKAGDFRTKELGDVCVIEYRSLGGGILNQGPGVLYDKITEVINLFNSDYVFTEEEIAEQYQKINNTELVTHE